MIAAVKAPVVDFAGLSPWIALLGGAVLVLLVGLFRSRVIREIIVPKLTVLAFAAAIGLSIWQWNADATIVSRALRVDPFTCLMICIFSVAGIVAVALAYRAVAPREAGHGEFHALLMASAAGMATLAAAQDLIVLFIGLELLSIPLYVLCATEMRRERSLESGIKYLIVGSVGSATLLYGLAMIYGATGDTSYAGIAEVLTSGVPVQPSLNIARDPLLIGGVALTVAGLAFKASLAPFHQWTPDVYQGAPTPITAFMSVATKAAAFAVILRLLNEALAAAQPEWSPLLAAIAVLSIIVGNVGALGQESLKRILAYSSIAQAGYLTIGVVVALPIGAQATIFYLCVYLLMTLTSFAVIVANERIGGSDSLTALRGLGRRFPVLAWPLTIAMLGLAGLPLTAGFVGKLYLIQASVEGDYTWLSIVLVLGSVVSLAYYLRVAATIWMTEAPEGAVPVPGASPAIAGGSPELDDQPDLPPVRKPQFELVTVALVGAAATIFFGVWPKPLLDLANEAGRALGLS